MGLLEWVVIALVALLVVGPKQWPSLLRQGLRAMLWVRQFMAGVGQQWQQTIHQLSQDDSSAGSSAEEKKSATPSDEAGS